MAHAFDQYDPEDYSVIFNGVPIEGFAEDDCIDIGLRSTDVARRITKPLELLDAVAERLQALPTQAERLWISDGIFGDEGSKILTMLKQGADGLRKLHEETRRMGRVLGSESIEQADRLTHSTHRLKDASINQHCV
jgi:hypothetical protein